MSNEHTQSVHEGVVRSALVQLLQQNGIACPEEAYTAKARLHASGRPFYVIVASPGMDAELEKIIVAATARHRGSLCGIWVLAERDASDLIRYSSAV